jgi:meso-butanediol dehydrogenase/(S,S)-butanediol dehydrogenase/diacetyl reductase
MGIEKRVVAITVATGRLGRITAKKFADQSARLVLVSTSPEKLEQLAAELALPEERILVVSSPFASHRPRIWLSMPSARQPRK